MRRDAALWKVGRRGLVAMVVLVGVVAWMSVGRQSAFVYAAAQPTDEPAGQPSAAEPKAPAAKEKASAAHEAGPSPKDAKAKKPTKSRGRLPDYFGAVVTEEQREKIYALQRQYDAKIDPLRQQIETLTKERNEKIRALLTPEQKQKIEELKAAAKKTRAAKKSTKKSVDPAAKATP